MQYFFGITFGCLILSIMLITYRLYLPKLKIRVDAEKISAGKETVLPAESVTSPFSNPHITMVLFGISTLVAGVCGYLVWARGAAPISVIKIAISLAVLACVFITDLELYIIPNIFSLILIGARIFLGIIEFVVFPEDAGAWAINSIVTLVIAMLFLLLMARITKGGLGFGDVKIFSTLGFMTGMYSFCYSLLFAFLTCAVISLFFLVGKKKGMKDLLPLGPFIYLGFAIAVMLGIA